jgi:diguanylate cyclase (GGDEF)-like protein/PAS domain S-box-containing protein
MVQYDRLDHLEETWFPMASLGAEMLHLFQTQIDRHEDVFLTGERDVDGELNSLNFHLLSAFDRLQELVQNKPDVVEYIGEIAEIKRDYILLVELSTKIEPWMAQSMDLTPQMQREIQQHGRLQMDLLRRFTALDKKFAASFIREIQRNKSKSLHATFFLGFLFVLVILCVTVITEKIAAHLLIRPLSAIKDNIKRFAVSHDVVEPVEVSSADEVGLLASAFWEMTRDLKTTTVSKKYVENIIRNMSGALVVLDPDGTINTVNEQALALFGYKESLLVGQQVVVLFSQPEENPLHGVQSLDNWFCRNVEVECKCKDGTVFQAHFSGSTMDNERGELAGLVCVLNDITEMKEAEEKLKKMALYDALTGLANRHLFFDRLEFAAHEALRNQAKFGLLFLDLDKFKPINDTLGHDIGDAVLRDVATRLQGLVRSADTVSRMGGDEFTIILTGLKRDRDAGEIAEKIIQCIGQPFVYGDVCCELGVSIGISLYPRDGDEAAVLINKADQAMYCAKKNGRNAHCYYNDIHKVQLRSPDTDI